MQPHDADEDGYDADENRDQRDVDELQARLEAVDFVERLRETRRFAGVGELVSQLHADVAAARRLLDSAG